MSRPGTDLRGTAAAATAVEEALCRPAGAATREAVAVHYKHPIATKSAKMARVARLLKGVPSFGDLMQRYVKDAFDVCPKA